MSRKQLLAIAVVAAFTPWRLVRLRTGVRSRTVRVTG
jgi:hypothetical protein